MKQFWIFLIIIAVVGLGVAYASRMNNQKTGVTQGVISYPSASPAATAPAASPSTAASPAVSPNASPSVSPAVLTVDMEAGSYYFKPNVIRAKKGETVRIVFHAVSMMHNFNVDALNVHSPTVRNGNTATFEFTPEKTGQFEFYCAIANHRAMGQVGTLIVQ